VDTSAREKEIEEKLRRREEDMLQSAGRYVMKNKCTKVKQNQYFLLYVQDFSDPESNKITDLKLKVLYGKILNV